MERHHLSQLHTLGCDWHAAVAVHVDDVRLSSAKENVLTPCSSTARAPPTMPSRPTPTSTSPISAGRIDARSTTASRHGRARAAPR